MSPMKYNRLIYFKLGSGIFSLLVDTRWLIGTAVSEPGVLNLGPNLLQMELCPLVAQNMVSMQNSRLILGIADR